MGAATDELKSKRKSAFTEQGEGEIKRGISGKFEAGELHADGSHRYVASAEKR